jgi:hypothetical protein
MGAAVTGVVESESLVVVIALTIMIAMRTFSSGAMRDAYCESDKASMIALTRFSGETAANKFRSIRS